MIVVCEKCDSRYFVPGHIVPPEGKTVRCTNCAHQWFHVPVKLDDDVSSDDAAEIDDTAPAPVRARTSAKKAVPAKTAVPAPEELPEEEEQEDLKAESDTDSEDDIDPQELVDALFDKEDDEPTPDLMAEDEDEDDSSDRISDDDIEALVGLSEQNKETFTKAVVEEEEQQDEDVSTEPAPEQEIVPQKIMKRKDEKPKKKKKKRGPINLTRVNSVAAAAGVMFLFFGIMVLFNRPLTKMFPITAAVFDAVGIEPVIQGQELKFAQLTVEAKPAANATSTLHIIGKVANFTDHTIKLPKMEASLRKSDGHVIDSWLIPFKEKKAKPDSYVSFEAVYPGATHAVKELNVQFVLHSKAVSIDTATGIPATVHSASSDHH